MDKFRETLVSMFCRRVELDGQRTAIYVHRGENFEPCTWNEVAQNVRRTAAALRRLGVQSGDRVVQVSENRYEWVVCDLAVHLTRGVHVAIHSTLTGPQIAYQIADSGAKLVIVSGPEQAAKLDKVAADLPPGLTFATHDPCEITIGKQSVGHLADCVSQTNEEEGRELEREALATVQTSDLATILYTSGTTGEPKGVMLSHGNLASNALASLEAFTVTREDLRLCWLPLSHIFARTADLYVWIGCGHQFAIAGSRETILADCAKLRPTLMNGVPYFFDKVYRALQEPGKHSDPSPPAPLPQAERGAREAGTQGRAVAPGALRQLLGGRMRLCCAGGAALPDHVAEFFERQGVTLVQGYGLTESSPVIATCNPQAHRIGTVGPPIPGVEVKIAEDGEVLTRGPHVMLGYWNKPEATAEAIHNGWLHTGDLGRLEDGFLRITGRKKELIVTAGGKNVAPTLIEGLLAEDPLVAQCMVIGDGRNYLTALIVPDREALRAEITRHQIPVTSATESLVHPAVRELYVNCIARRLAGLSNCEQIGKFTLLPRAFSIEEGELTPTLKLRRSVIAEHFAEAIREMYSLESRL